jgi:hypothetical protein
MHKEDFVRHISICVYTYRVLQPSMFLGRSFLDADCAGYAVFLLATDYPPPFCYSKRDAGAAQMDTDFSWPLGVLDETRLESKLCRKLRHRPLGR